jgi:hypothetical protein
MFIWVYKYRYWDPDLGALETSRNFFTLDAIRDGLGMAIIESGMKVAIGEVDERGQLKVPPGADFRPYAERQLSRDRSS